MVGTFGGALDARQIDAGNGKLTDDVTGEVDKEEGVLVIRRIHMAMRLVAPERWSACLGFTRCGVRYTAPYTTQSNSPHLSSSLRRHRHRDGTYGLEVVSGRLFLISSLPHQDRNRSWKVKFSRFRWKGCNFSRIECVFLLRQRARIRSGVGFVRH